MKVGTITFHGSHNYGSMLQAYALQKYIHELLKDHDDPCENLIINYRSEVQKRIYKAPEPTDLKNLLKWLLYLPYRKQLKIQEEKFEAFITDHLSVTEEFSSETRLPEIASAFDLLIAGSDQIWNVRARDFDFTYLLPGCSSKKISYAVSLGPLSIDWKQYNTAKLVNLLKSFSTISVRERKSLEMLHEIFSDNQAELMPDPVFLLPAEEWREIQSDMNPGKYILFYCLEPTPEQIRIAKMFSRTLNLPVVSTAYRNKYDYFNPFNKQYDAGPCDFLSLVDHASLVLTSSFHGTAFSIIYNKPFFVMNGMEDGRIRDLMYKFRAKKNLISPGLKKAAMPPSIGNPIPVTEKERIRAKEFLLNAFNIERNSLYAE